ncbi:MAG: radical SAM protein [Promethearchaeota archaeon]
MRVSQVLAKNIITKCNIPGIDYVINPYTGCQHACIYCYAEFMKRFTGHVGEKWGDFLDVKTFDVESIKPERFDGKSILLSSVTDPYTPLEAKYKNTRRILEKLIGTKADLRILTKSSLMKRDIDLFKQFENIQVGISLNSLDIEFARAVEPRASKPHERLDALRSVSKAGVHTYVFVSPIFPKISDWRAIIDSAVSTTDDFRFENINFRGHNVSRIFELVSEGYPQLLDYYKQIRKDPLMWDEIEDDIVDYCESKKIRYKIEFHHGGFSKNR